MALTTVEQLMLWGPPVLTILFAVGYYVRWGKESHDGESRSGGGS
ncbi:MAG: hypothetical protein ABEJ76_03235 [Halanaeroarchaeum sp.]